MTKLQSQGREPFEAVDRAPEAQADGFATVRQAHESEMAEDYVELIAELIETRGEARPVEIAERRRHRVVVAFLLSLGIDEETAECDAEGSEHHVSGTTLEAFERRLNQK